jgi:hypothetical protein
LELHGRADVDRDTTLGQEMRELFDEAAQLRLEQERRRQRNQCPRDVPEDVRDKLRLR